MQCPKCGEFIQKPRSLNENSYLHGVVLPILSEWNGDTPNQWKLFLKKEFGWIRTKEMFGKIIEEPISTAEMTTTDFEKFMTQIRMFGDSLGVYIPEPNSPNLNELV